MWFWIAAAMAAEVSVSAGEVRVDGAVVAAYPTPPRAAVEEEGRLYVLTADGALQTWEVTPPRLLSTVTVPGAEGLFVADGRVWVERRETRAVPVAEVARGGGGAVTTQPLPPLPSGTPAAPAAPARVLSVGNGVAVVDRGALDGLAVGAQVRFLGVETQLVPAMDTKGTERRPVERVVAAGRVRLTEDHRALVDLARGGRVDEGDRLELHPGAYTYPVAPERLGGLVEVGKVVRPLLALQTVGAAVVAEAWVTWVFRTPWYVQARLAPVGLGWSRDGNPFTVAGLGTAGFDSRAFSVGLGAGWSMLDSDPGVSGLPTGPGAPQVSIPHVNRAFAFVQEARLGARDGLRVAVRNTLLLAPTYRVEYVWNTAKEAEDIYVVSEGDAFVFGGIAMELAVPTGDRTDLFVDWGTGRAGATWVEGGVSSWLRGNGDRGSVGLRVGAGYASVRGNADQEAVELYGPMVSVGGRVRF
ncbi:MAG: hypothetical protein Q7U06_00350 [Pseudomonadota bacterium]|nr:hypothetical protein [Pseudomonadota bacterium]